MSHCAVLVVVGVVARSVEAWLGNEVRDYGGEELGISCTGTITAGVRTRLSVLSSVPIMAGRRSLWVHKVVL